LRKIPGRMTGRFPRRTGFLFIIVLMLSTTVFLSVACSRRADGISWRGSIQPDIMRSFDTSSSSGFVVIEMPEDIYDDSGTYISTEPRGMNGIGPLPAPSFRDERIVLEEQKVQEPVQHESSSEELKVSSSDKMPTDSHFSEDLVLEEVTELEDVEPNDPEKDENTADPSLAEDALILEEESVCWSEYHVRAGETLTDICRDRSLTPKGIADANELTNPDYLKEGQLLLIPSSPENIEKTIAEVKRRRAEEIARQNRVEPVEVDEYTVQEGDSLWSISNKLNISIDTLFASNKLKDPDYLKPGSKLRVPNQDGLFHKIQKGNTLGSIAKKFKTEPERIIKANPGADLDVLKVGMELFIPGASPAASVFRLSDGRSSTYSRGFRWPVAGRINSPFGWRRHPITKKRNFHTGIDIKARTGRIIRAARNGRVAYAGWMGGYGRVVVVNHGNGYSTLYAHCSRLLVRKGRSVSSGQAIAKAGSSGRTTGPHLHFEVRKNNKAINPLRVLK